MTRNLFPSDMTSKVCFKCGETKPIEEYYKHPRMADGHLGKCIECTRKDVAEYQRGKGHERICALKKAYAKTEGRKAQMAQFQRKYYQQNPDRWRAKIALQWARRRGLLVPPDSCPACGGGGRLHAHHNDYSKPLEVEWLCEHCHRELRHRTYEYA
jgi:hypothetical protein